MHICSLFGGEFNLAVTLYTHCIYVAYLAVILIWRFGKSHENH